MVPGGQPGLAVPLTIAQQLNGAVAYQPLGGGWHLPDTIRYPSEDRIGLADPHGTLRSCWRLTSRTVFAPVYPQARLGNNTVEFAEVWTARPNELEYLVVRFFVHQRAGRPGRAAVLPANLTPVGNAGSPLQLVVSGVAALSPL